MSGVVFANFVFGVVFVFALFQKGFISKKPSEFRVMRCVCIRTFCVRFNSKMFLQFLC